MNQLLSEEGWTQLFINPLYPLIIMMGILLAGYFIGKNNWIKKDNKWVSALIYIFTFIGIISMTYDNRCFILNTDKKLIQQRIEIDFQRELLHRLDWFESYYSEPFVKSEYSPINFDEIQKERSILYNWLFIHKEYIKNNINNLEFIREDSLQYPYDEFKETTNIQDLDYVKKNVDDYNYNLSKLDRIRNNIDRNDYEIIISIIYPFLFIIGLSLQFIKEFYLTKD